MNVWAVANQKGGVGKTTTAVTVAGFLAKMGYRTLMVDLDPHGSLTSYFGQDPEAVEKGVYSLFEEAGPEQDLSPLIQSTTVDNLDFMPASLAMATLDRQLGLRGGMGLVIQRALTRLEDDYDYALLDCPPMLGVLMVNALAACEKLIVPVQTEFLALKGLDRMINTMNMVRRSLKRDLDYVIVPTMYDRRTKAAPQALDMLKAQHSDTLWHSVIPVDTMFREASRAGEPLSSLKPYARGAKAYREFLNYLMRQQDEELAQSATGTEQ